MLINAFRNGLGTPVGYVMPLRRAWWQAQPGWVAGKWPVRSEKVFLLPGESPIGLRLPLDALPSAANASNAVYTTPMDPSAPLTPMTRPKETPKGNERTVLREETLEAENTLPMDGREQPLINEQILEEKNGDPSDGGDENVVQTALCVECRHVRLYVFLPPCQHRGLSRFGISHRDTCRKLNLPVVIEGYPPPPTTGSNFGNPRPGVIEVNSQPTETWEQLVELTETLYEEARLCRLGTNKFDLDGRHTGTGGGNHMVLGGKTPLDSPFLRRPDLLASLIKFWNNHPSLSYLFSSRFIGPTSQAPRFDESRHDAVYEMEIALSQLPPRGQEHPPWLVDRLFRDLLVDLTGNTHRAEICIDKLYSPDSSTGRLGLVELRGFEMPPHARMSLASNYSLRHRRSILGTTLQPTSRSLGKYVA